MTEDEVREIQRQLEPTLADLVGFLYASAWRSGEARGLRWEWVQDDAIRLPTSKNGLPRTLAIAGEVVDILERRRLRELGDYVFHRHGLPVRNFDYAWRTACRRAGLEGRLIHDLRRSAIKRMVEAGCDQKTAMSISGHVTVSTFHRYQIVDVHRQAEVLERLSRPPSRDSAPAPKQRLRNWGAAVAGVVALWGNELQILVGG